MRPAALRPVLAGAALSLAAALLAGVPAAAGGVPATSAALVDQPLRVGTYNIRAGVGQADFEKAVSAFKPMADVIGLQEIGATDRGTYLASDSTWGYYRPPALQQNPILWNRALFDFVGADGVVIAEKRDLGTEHSGDEEKGDSLATVVRLVQRSTGQQLSFINVHLVRGAVKGGLPAPGKPKLFDLYTDQVAGTVKAIKNEREKSDEVFVLGDFNVGYEADVKRKHRKLPYMKYTGTKKRPGIGLRSMWQGSPLLKKAYGTHNDALIDQVWSTGNSSAEAIVRTIKASDHSPAVATYQLPADPGYVPVTGAVGFDAGDLQQSNNEGDGLAREWDLVYKVTGDSGHGFVDVKITGADVSTKYQDGGDFIVDLSTFYDDNPNAAAVRLDFQGDRQGEPDVDFTIQLIGSPSATVLPGLDTATGTMTDDD